MPDVGSTECLVGRCCCANQSSMVVWTIRNEGLKPFNNKRLYSVAVITPDSESSQNIPATPVRFRVRPLFSFLLFFSSFGSPSLRLFS